MSVVSVINHKGGVAKTTTSINVAAGWAGMGKKVLLVDLDPQASATFAIFGHREFETTVYDLLVHRKSPQEAIVTSETFGFDVIPSELLLSGVDIQLSAQFGRERILKKQMDQVKTRYDAILIDCSPSLGLLTVNALLASRDIIIPICPEYFSIKGIDLILDTIHNIRMGLGYKINVRGIVITRYRNRRVVNEVIAELKNKYDLKVFTDYIPDNISIEEAHHNHVPVLKYAPESKGSQAYQSLARNLWL